MPFYQRQFCLFVLFLILLEECSANASSPAVCLELSVNILCPYNHSSHHPHCTQCEMHTYSRGHYNIVLAGASFMDSHLMFPAYSAPENEAVSVCQGADRFKSVCGLHKPAMLSFHHALL